MNFTSLVYNFTEICLSNPMHVMVFTGFIQKLHGGHVIYAYVLQTVETVAMFCGVHQTALEREISFGDTTL